MAKKKRSTKKRPGAQSPTVTLAVVDTAELVADSDNPRRISDEAVKGLQHSLDRFGDLSGIVFNQRTFELVCGHQRMDQIRKTWGDRKIEVLDKEAELGVIRIDEEHHFPVRIVNWSIAMQRAANAAANSQKISGQFDDTLTEYLLTVQAELQETEPGLLQDVLLVELMDIKLEEEPRNFDLPTKYQVHVDLESENQQEEVQKLLTNHGWQCKAITN